MEIKNVRSLLGKHWRDERNKYDYEHQMLVIEEIENLGFLMCDYCSFVYKHDATREHRCKEKDGY